MCKIIFVYKRYDSVIVGLFYDTRTAIALILKLVTNIREELDGLCQ